MLGTNLLAGSHELRSGQLFLRNTDFSYLAYILLPLAWGWKTQNT